MRYSAVLLDVGETLIGPRERFGAAYARIFGALGVELPPERFELAIRRTWEQVARETPPGVDRYGHHDGGEEAFWLRFAGRSLELASGRTHPESIARRALDGLRDHFATPAAWQVYPDTVPTLERLRAAGLKLGVVSNWDSRLPRVLEMLDLARYFDAVGVSHLEGMEKPRPEFFLRVLSRLGVGADRALHVGDVPELDLAGARAAGVDALLVDRHGRLDGEHDALRDLTPLPGLVAG
jgi:putative hydrolase of the HAD superfamily